MAQSKPRVAAIGMFDGVHTGHRVIIDALLNVARDLNYKPAVFTFERHPLEVIDPEHAPQLLTPWAVKRHKLSGLGVAEVMRIPFNQTIRQLTAREFMQRLHDKYNVRALVIGYDHGFGSDRPASFEAYKAIGDEIGIDVRRASRLDVGGETVSSSAIRKLLSDGDIQRANAMLGTTYSLSGSVVEGRKLGRSLGFPTANLAVDTRLMLPADGVYAGRVLVDGEKWPAIINIGTNPTVSDEGTRTIEAHLIGFDGDLYGKHPVISFMHRLRDEQRFDSREDLRLQLDKDRADAMRLLMSL